MDLKTPLNQASKAYKMYARRLEKLGILKLEDFLFHIPFRYEDFSLVSEISKVQPGEIVTIQGNVKEIKNQYTKRFKTIQRAVIADETGQLDIMWFNQPFLARVLIVGERVSLSGKIDLDKNKLIMRYPDYEVIYNNQTIHTGRFVPVYSETRGVSSKWLRRQVFKLLEEKEQIKDYFPESILKENNLIDLTEALEKIHFPKNLEEVEKAKERLAFNELLSSLTNLWNALRGKHCWLWINPSKPI